MTKQVGSVRALLVGALAVVFGLGAGATTIDESAFAYRMEISVGSGKVTTSLQNFPVLVRLSAMRCAGFDPTACGTDGADLRFALPDGTLLNHEIDTWRENGESHVWVNVPTLAPDTKFYAYWGLQAGHEAPSVAHGAAWPNYVAVYHLSEASGVPRDSSPNRYDATNGADVAASDTAIVGRSRAVANNTFKTGVLTLLGGAHPLTSVSKFTISGWMFEDSSTEAGYRVLMSKGSWDSTGRGWYANTQNSRKSFTAVSCGNQTKAWNFPSGKTLAKQWHYLTLAYNAGKAEFWLDGVSLGSGNLKAVVESTTYGLNFGGNLTGYLDEVRLMDGATSGALAAADYATQTDAAFLSYADVEVPGVNFRVAAVPDQHLVEPTCCPKPAVTDIESGALLVEGEDFRYEYAFNDAPGTALVRVVGLGAYETGTVVCGFVVHACYHVVPSVEEEGDGRTWEHPMSLTNAAVHATAADDMIMLKAGTYSLLNGVSFAKTVWLSGGYSGANGAERAANAVSVLDGLASANPFVNLTASVAGQVSRFDGLDFRNCKRGIVKTGASDVLFTNCAFTANSVLTGSWNQYTEHGRGAKLSGTGTDRATFIDCRFLGNGDANKAANESTYGDGLAVYLSSVGRATFDNCLFLTNGISSAGWKGGYAMRGTCIYASSTPVTARNCSFVGNGCNAGHSAGKACGGNVVITGSSGASAFTNCLFQANANIYYNSTDCQYGSALSFVGGAVDTPLDVVNCTFAYNVSQGSRAPADLLVVKGAANVRNSIFYGGAMGKGMNASCGADIHVCADATATIGHSMLTAKTTAYVTEAASGLITYGEGGEDTNVYGDPKFVSSASDALALMVSGAAIPSASGAVRYESFANTQKLDAHLLSTEGYYDATGGVHKAVGVQSPAIDAGDPDMDVGAELAPNGGVINMGCYGGTAQASHPAASHPSIEGAVNVTFPDGISQPQIDFRLGSIDAYNADVTIYCGTGALAQAGTAWDQVVTLKGVPSGSCVTQLVDSVYLKGDTLYVKVYVTAKGAVAPVTTPILEKTVEGEIPAWWNAKGPDNVIHVRLGAKGKGTGLSWRDALASVGTALVQLSAEKNEIWIAGDFDLEQGLTFSPSASATIRGGFTGSECAASERIAGKVTTLDGKDRAWTDAGYAPGSFVGLIAVENAAGRTVTVESIEFARAWRGFYKKGAGDLLFTNCVVTSNSRAGGSSQTTWQRDGRGVMVEGSDTAKVTFVGCRFADNGNGNRFSTSQLAYGDGLAVGLYNVGHATFDDCLFVTNGVSNANVAGGYAMRGTCIFAKSAPLTVRNCRFIGNGCHAGANYDGQPCGGAVNINGASPSAFTNCLFMANQNLYYNKTGCVHGASISYFGSATNTPLELVNCTFAYNVSQGTRAPAGVLVGSGTAKIRNSIFYGNTMGKGTITSCGADLHVCSNATAQVEYSLFSGKTATNVTEAVGAVVTYGSEGVDNNVYGDPLLVTTANDALACLSAKAAIPCCDDAVRYTDLAGATRFNAHLRGRYVDELTGLEVKVGRRSPAVDAGDPADDCANEPKPNGERINLGFYGNTPWATRSKLPAFLLLVK